jgi:hypothetical protein
VISRAGATKARVTITECSMNHDNKSFILQASTDGLNTSVIAPALSDPMTSVKYRLIIQNKCPVPDVFFKDEGGRDKTIDLNVHLCDHTGAIVTDRKVPLKVVLLYEKGHEVHSQDILRIAADIRQCVIDERGTILLRMRIEDVSKNHQKQRFRIKIMPDTFQFPFNNDISADCCDPIEVRSKPKKKHGMDSSFDAPTFKRRPFPHLGTEYAVYIRID